MDCPDGFSAAVPGNGNLGERARLHGGGHDQDRAAASQDESSERSAMDEFQAGLATRTDQR